MAILRTPVVKPKRIGIPDMPWQVGLGPKPKPAARPKPPTDVELAQQQISPIVAEITRRAQAQAGAAGNAIRGYTGSLAQQLAGMNFGAPYAQAIPQQAAVDEALRASLSGQGAELAQGLRDRLASMQEPGATGQAANAVAGFGAGTGNTALANGSASLGALIANQAAANSYGQKLPGIAGLAGIQGLSRAQGQAQSQIADQTGQLTARIPDIVANIQQNRVAQSAAADRQKQLQIEHALTIWQATGKLPKGYAKILGLPAGTKTLDATPKPVKPPPPKIVHTADGSVLAVDPMTGETIKTISGPRKSTSKPLKPQTFKGTDGRTYIYDPKTQTAKPIPGQSPAKPEGATKKTPSAATVKRWHAQALGMARIGHRESASGEPPVTWQVYMNTALEKGIPPEIIIEEGRKVYSQAEIHQGLIPGAGGG